MSEQCILHDGSVLPSHDGFTDSVLRDNQTYFKKVDGKFVIPKTASTKFCKRWGLRMWITNTIQFAQRSERYMKRAEWVIERFDSQPAKHKYREQKNELKQASVAVKKAIQTRAITREGYYTNWHHDVADLKDDKEELRSIKAKRKELAADRAAAKIELINTNDTEILCITNAGYTYKANDTFTIKFIKTTCKLKGDKWDVHNMIRTCKRFDTTFVIRDGVLTVFPPESDKYTEHLKKLEATSVKSELYTIKQHSVKLTTIKELETTYKENKSIHQAERDAKLDEIAQKLPKLIKEKELAKRRVSKSLKNKKAAAAVKKHTALMKLVMRKHKMRNASHMPKRPTKEEVKEQVISERKASPQTKFLCRNEYGKTWVPGDGETVDFLVEARVPTVIENDVLVFNISNMRRKICRRTHRNKEYRKTTKAGLIWITTDYFPWEDKSTWREIVKQRKRDREKNSKPGTYTVAGEIDKDRRLHEKIREAKKKNTPSYFLVEPCRE